jgi:hypothetical protein
MIDDTPDRASSDRAIPERPVYGSIHGAPADMAAPRRRPIAAWLIAAVAVAFAIGLLANPWFERNVRSRLPGMRSTASDVAASQTIAALQARIDSLEARTVVAAPPAPGDPAASAEIAGVAEAQASTEIDLAELQTQVAELRGRTDSTAAAAAQGAERAQTALLVSALRRAVEAGRRLDAYEPALRARFGASHPNEVAALLSLGQRPVESRGLALGLARAQPAIERADAEGRNWWESFRHGLAGIVAVRRADDAPVDPASQLRLAMQRAEAGDIDAALRTVAALPPASRPALAGWTAEARRYAAGMNALATLEAAALNPVPAVPVPPTTL